MDEPEYLICLECETPCYVFEYRDGALVSAQCLACGSDEPDEFMTEEEFEAMTSSGH